MTKNTKKVDYDGLMIEEMNIKMLQEVAVSLGLFSKEEVAKMKKADILKVVRAWEKKAVEENTDKATGLRKLGGVNTVKVVDEVETDLYNGKAVQSRTTREINGKLYEDVLLVSGETFTNPITE